MSSGQTHKSTESLISYASEWYNTFDGGATHTNVHPQLVTFKPYQEIYSQGNPWPSGKGRGNTGGYFYSSKYTYSNWGSGPYELENGSYGYVGHYFPVNLGNRSKANWPARVASSSDMFLHTLGTTAIARCEPTNPVSGTAVALAELKADGLPTLVGHSFFKERLASVLSNERAILSKNGKIIAGPSVKKDKASVRNLGEENLNYQFAIRPLINDVKSLRKSVRETDRILKQFKRDSGRSVRRKYRFPEERTVTVTYDANAYGTAQNNDTSRPRMLTTTVETTTNRWFSAAFTYYVPDNDVSRFLAEADKLYGVKLTPEVVWNLAPWSWAADWVTNFGDVAHNVSAFGKDGLVMQYGYMMEHRVQRVTYNWRGYVFKKRGISVPVDTTQIFEHEVKKRVAASPFGFGLTWDTFTPRQIGIAASLGLTQGRK